MSLETTRKHHLSWQMTIQAWVDPLTWISDKSAQSILDLGCGQGKSMMFLLTRIIPQYTVGVDLFKPYIQEAKANKIHDKYILTDIRHVTFPPQSFDIVMASHVIEHLPKSDGWKVVKNMEKIAKRQVIIATPFGEMHQPMIRGNKLEEHQSHFFPEEFEKKGYKVMRYGWRWLLDEHSESLMHTITNPLLKRLLYSFNLLLTPVYYLFQNTCDYTFIAYKDVSKQHK